MSEKLVKFGLLENDNIAHEKLFVSVSKLCTSKFKYGNHPNLLCLFETGCMLRKIPK